MKRLKSFPKGFFVIAGPCIIEGEGFTLKIAEKLKKISEKSKIPLIFKASFDKANRSSIDSFRGPGLEKGLKILSKVKTELELPVLSDVHTPDMISLCCQVLDVIQIPAFLARQTDFYLEAGKHSCLINVKKGQFMSPKEMPQVIQKFRSSGGKHLSITERGSFFGYGNLVVDFRSIQIIKSLKVPYIYDATHSLQLPAVAHSGKVSGGEIEFLESLTKAQIAGGANALFIETHPNPKRAKSDAATQYPLDKLEVMLKKLKQLYDFVQKN